MTTALLNGESLTGLSILQRGAADDCRLRNDSHDSNRCLRTAFTDSPGGRILMATNRDFDPLHANKPYLEILQLAAQEGAALVDAALGRTLEDGEDRCRQPE